MWETMTKTTEVERWERSPKRKTRSERFFSQPRPPLGFRLPTKPSPEPVRGADEPKLTFLLRKRKWVERRGVYFIKLSRLLDDHPEASEILGFTKRDITSTFGPAVSREKERVLIEIEKTVAHNRRLTLRRSRQAYEARHPERARRFSKLRNREVNDYERD